MSKLFLGCRFLPASCDELLFPSHIGQIHAHALEQERFDTFFPCCYGDCWSFLSFFFRETCSPVTRKSCEPTQVEECQFVPKEVTDRKCSPSSERICSNVEKLVPRTVCSPVERQVCKPMTKKECETKTVQNCKKVCIKRSINMYILRVFDQRVAISGYLDNLYVLLRFW